jgi:hypothetical protein
MQAAHVVDNRRGVTGLKFQTFVMEGILNWGDDMKPYLEARDGDNGNSRNRIKEANLHQLLVYGAKDSLHQLRNAKRLMPMVGRHPCETSCKSS